MCRIPARKAVSYSLSPYLPISLNHQKTEPVCETLGWVVAVLAADRRGR